MKRRNPRDFVVIGYGFLCYAAGLLMGHYVGW